MYIPKELAKDREQALKLLQQGVSIIRVMEIFKRSESWVKKICYLHGIPVPKTSVEYSKSNYPIIADLINTSKSFSEIGRDRNISRERVRQIAEKLKEHKVCITDRK